MRAEVHVRSGPACRESGIKAHVDKGWHARTLSCCAPAHTLYTTTRVGIRRVVCARYPLHGVIFRREMPEPARRGSALPQHPSRREGEGIGAQAAPCPSTHASTRM